MLFTARADVGLLTRVESQVHFEGCGLATFNAQQLFICQCPAKLPKAEGPSRTNPSFAQGLNISCPCDRALYLVWDGVAFPLSIQGCYPISPSKEDFPWPEALASLAWMEQDLASKGGRAWWLRAFFFLGEGCS